MISDEQYQRALLIFFQERSEANRIEAHCAVELNRHVYATRLRKDRV